MSFFSPVIFLPSFTPGIILDKDTKYRYKHTHIILFVTLKSWKQLHVY